MHLALRDSRDMPGALGADEPADGSAVRVARGTIRARGRNQRDYLANIHSKDLTFGIGPAGTGKTYLAVACAVEALQADKIRRIILVRPAVEAGERLGFLPGDLTQKVDPYLRPMYDALYEMLGFDRVARYIERNVIEVAPLAFMRGRSLNDSFIILDEAQNTTPEQMKMFLTRIGFGSRAVVTGDVTQTDLPAGKLSGLRHVINILRNTDGVAFTFFEAADVVRHPLVQRIVQAYEAHTPTEQDMSRGARPQAGPRSRHARLGAGTVAHESLGRGGAGPPRRGPRDRGARRGGAREPRVEPLWRGKDKPTNVLSFPATRSRTRARQAAGLPPAARRPGDLRARWCGAKRYATASRWLRTGRTWWFTARCTSPATTTRPGARERMRMERREIAVLKRFGIGNPYT